jgi:hypothetical protein
MSQALLAKKVARLAAYKVQKRRTAHGRDQARPSLSAMEADWRFWLRTLFPGYVTHTFAPHQEALWDCLWALPKAVRPHPFMGI